MLSYGKRFSENNDNPLGDFLRGVEHREIIRQLHLQRGDRILEVGCNSGNFVKKLRKNCDNVTGIDINKDAITSSGVGNLFCMSAEALDFSEGSFSKIVSMHTIEHVPDFKKALGEMCRVVESGGRVVLSYPFELFRGMTALPTACFVYKNPMMCRQLHLHRLNLAKIKDAVKGTGLSVVFHKVAFTPFPTYVTVLEKSGQC